MAQQRKRNKRKISFEQLLAEEAIKFKEAAAKEPAGAARSAGRNGIAHE